MSTVTVAFSATVLLYAGSATLFFVYLGRGADEAGRWATRTLAAAIAAHLGLLLVAYNRFASIGDIHGTLAVLSLAIALGYLVTMRRHRLTVLGAFITPITLLLLLGAGVRSEVARVPEGVRSALLPVHIGVIVLGVVAFALAFGAAVGYLIQERLLRQKQVVGVFQRLPALDVLDSLGLRLVTLGFPLFTLGVIIGTLWLKDGGFGFSTGQGFGLVAWGFFGAVLLARAAAGWRGRRAAIGTMLGFLCTLVAIGSYLLRGTGAA